MGIMGGTDADFMEACDRRNKQPSATSVSSPAYGAKVIESEPGRVLIITPGMEHGMEWWEAQNFAARIMDAAALAVKAKSR